MRSEDTKREAILESVLAGDQQAIARMLTLIERRVSGIDHLLALFSPYAGRAHIVGVTGPPGSGKSTLVSALANDYRTAGCSVGILAVDPSSVVTGGAILGDRIRMADLSNDGGVFIRSMASRGALGGLSRAVLDSVTVLDASGKDVVIIETVGVGQVEVDIVRSAHTVVVVSVPGLGDDVQVIKAGLLEVADLHVVNKADREGADRTFADLRTMTHLSPYREGDWEVAIVRTCATSGDGIQELMNLLNVHRSWLEQSGEIQTRNRNMASRRIQWLAEQLISDVVAPGRPRFEAAACKVAEGRMSAMDAALELLGGIASDMEATKYD